jgi:oligosaccharide repeat unit polymerase
MFTGSEKTYFDFGIPTIHGFLNGLISCLSLISFYEYLTTKKITYLLLALFIVFWGVIAVTRQIIIVNLIQYMVLYFILKRPKASTIARLIIITVFIGLSFGWIGDARTGADKFINLAMPSESYPDKLPSGVLWVYMYAVTPLMNMLYTINTSCGCESAFFGNTIAPLLPSILRSLLLPTDRIEKGNVISEAFNVSTAFVDSFTDSGYVGVAIFTAIIAVPTIYFWHKTAVRDSIIFAILAQCLILTIFYNHYFSLPVISQVFWVYILFSRKRSSSIQRVMS